MNPQNVTLDKEPIWCKNLVLVMTLMVCIVLAGQVLLPTMPLYAVELGASKGLAGLMNMLFSVGALTFRPYAGRLIDSSGRKKTLVIGTLIYIIPFIAYMVFDSYLINLMFRFIHGVSLCIITTSLSTMATDLIPQTRLTEGIGYYGLASAIALTLGPALGLRIKSNFNMNGIFVFGIVITIVSLLLATLIAYPEQINTSKRSKKPKLQLVQKSSVIPASMILVVTLSQCLLITHLAIYGGELGISNIGNFFLLTSLGTVVSRLVAGKAANKFGEHRVLYFGSIVSFISFISIAYLQNYTMLISTALIYGFGYGAIYPIANAMSVRSCKPQDRGKANATFFAFLDLGQVIGNLGWGVVSDVVGYRATYTIAGISMLNIIWIYYFLYNKKRG